MKGNRIGAAVLVAALLVGLLGLPALASTVGVGTFAGNAQVGHWFRSAEPCDKDGQGVPDGEGLYWPAVVERDRSGVWRLSTVFVFNGQSRGVLLNDTVGGFLNVCGQLDREALGLGAACGASKGFAGRGRAYHDDPNRLIDLKLFNVGWKEALGGVLPVTGNYQEYGTDQVTKGKIGTFVALVRVAPGTVDQIDDGVLACAKLDGGNGAKTFAATGTMAFLDEVVDVGKDPGGKQCRDDGPADKGATPPPIVACPEPGAGK